MNLTSDDKQSFLMLFIICYKFVLFLFYNIKKGIMKTIDEIKTDAFKEFLIRLGNHKIGECMDIVSMNVNYEKIKIPKQK